jgi:hypothetical protein
MLLMSALLISFFIYSPLITPLHAVTEQLGITKKTESTSANKAGVCSSQARNKAQKARTWIATQKRKNENCARMKMRAKTYAAPLIRWTYQPSLPAKTLRLWLIHPDTLQQRSQICLAGLP